MSGDEVYLLNHLRGDVDEDVRLDQQHRVVKAIVDGNCLLHKEILERGLPDAIADIGCGTGVWLNDVWKDYYSTAGKHASLVGWDLNSGRFVKARERGVELYEHDCTKPFHEEFTERFDVVNIRILWTAIRKDAWPMLLKNALKLLKPGGYLHWIEGEPSNIKSIPATREFDAIVKKVNEERAESGLVTHVPSFMLQSLLGMGEMVEVLHFDLVDLHDTKVFDSTDKTLHHAYVQMMFNATKAFLSGMIQSATTKGEQVRVVELRHSEAFLDSMIAEPEKWSFSGRMPKLLAKKKVSTEILESDDHEESDSYSYDPASTSHRADEW